MSRSAHPIQLRVPRRAATLACCTVLLGAGLAACGGRSTPSASTPSIAPLGSGSRAAGGFGGSAPAAFGLAAAISGSTIEVQDPSTGQVSVSFSSKTAFTQTRTVTVAALAVGQCVTAVGARPSGSTASGSTASGSTASGSTAAGSALPTSFSATSVTISPAVNGSCTGGFGGGRGRPSGSARPSGSERPSGARPSGAAGGFGGGAGFGGLATGKLSALSGSTMQVQVSGRGAQTGGTDTITLTSTTTYSETSPANSAALKVGECVTATGTADSTGAVAASRIALSPAGPNGCSAGFGRRPRPSGSSTGA